VSASQVYDPELNEPGTIAAGGGCSHHRQHGSGAQSCSGEAVVSFQDSQGDWQSGCAAALEQLVARGEIAPLGQGA
jgi:hypothetical protein